MRISGLTMLLATLRSLQGWDAAREDIPSLRPASKLPHALGSLVYLLDPSVELFCDCVSHDYAFLFDCKYIVSAVCVCACLLPSPASTLGISAGLFTGGSK